jgi:hypothetical protein
MRFFLAAALAAGPALALPFEGRDLVRIDFSPAGAFENFHSLPGFGRDDFETISQDHALVWTTAESRAQITGSFL